MWYFYIRGLWIYSVWHFKKQPKHLFNTRITNIWCKKTLRYISKKQSKELLSEGDRTAWVNCQEEVQKAQDDVLKAKKARKEEQTLFNRLERNFIAVRKIASLVNLTNTVIDESQKYV